MNHHRTVIEGSSPGEPWERVDGESARSFELFARYRDLGPGRSLSRLAEETGRSVRRLAEHSRRWSWTTRAAAFDAHLDAIKVESIESERRRMIERHAKLASAAMGRLVDRLGDADSTQIRGVGEWSAALERLVRVERLSRGVPTEITEQQGQTVDLLDLVHPGAAEVIRRSGLLVDDSLGRGPMTAERAKEITDAILAADDAPPPADARRLHDGAPAR